MDLKLIKTQINKMIVNEAIIEKLFSQNMIKLNNQNPNNIYPYVTSYFERHYFYCSPHAHIDFESPIEFGRTRDSDAKFYKSVIISNASWVLFKSYSHRRFVGLEFYGKTDIRKALPLIPGKYEIDYALGIELDDYLMKKLGVKKR